jgi:isopentenyl-diphosphate delta-isomerase
MPDGVVENELCPVYRVTCTGEPKPDPAEVAEYRWVDWALLGEPLGRAELSPWCVLQLTELERLGPVPSDWPVAERSLLPPAARTAGA